MDVELLLIMELWGSLGLFGKAVAVLLGLHPLASLIVALTPTPKDDALLSQVYSKVLKPLALAVGKAKPGIGSIGRKNNG